jgi:hypothetical protein
MQRTILKDGQGVYPLRELADEFGSAWLTELLDAFGTWHEGQLPEHLRG